MRLVRQGVPFRFTEQSWWKLNNTCMRILWRLNRKEKRRWVSLFMFQWAAIRSRLIQHHSSVSH